MTTSPSIAEARERLTKIVNWDRSPAYKCCTVRFADLRALLAETRGDEGFSLFGAKAPSSGTEQASEPAAEPFIGFMCKTDFDYEMRGASDGARIYPSESGLRRERKCVDQCGVVAVRVTLERLVQDEDYDAALSLAVEGGST